MERRGGPGVNALAAAPGEPFLKGDPGRTHRFQQDLTLAALTRQEFCGLRQRPDFLTDATRVTGLITERGICRASAESLAAMFPEHRA